MQIKVVQQRRGTHAHRKRGEGVKNNYIVVDYQYSISIYNAENAKQAICQYALNCGLDISVKTFEKAIQNLEIEEIVELFNQNCLGYTDKIKQIFTSFITLYDETKGGD